MPKWKSDPLYREVFAEIRALWDEVEGRGGPLLFRVEERSPSSRPTEVWLYDDAGFRVVPMLRREPHDYGPASGGFHRFGLVWFLVADDRRKLTLGYRLGPQITGEILYEVETEGDAIFLMADTGSMSF